MFSSLDSQLISISLDSQLTSNTGTQTYRNKHAETIDSSSSEITSLSHLRDRLERVPELNAIGRNISKHLKILSELNRHVEDRIYFESTRVAQRLAVSLRERASVTLEFQHTINLYTGTRTSVRIGLFEKSFGVVLETECT